MTQTDPFCQAKGKSWQSVSKITRSGSGAGLPRNVLGACHFCRKGGQGWLD